MFIMDLYRAYKRKRQKRLRWLDDQVKYQYSWEELNYLAAMVMGYEVDLVPKNADVIDGDVLVRVGETKQTKRWNPIMDDGDWHSFSKTTGVPQCRTVTNRHVFIKNTIRDVVRQGVPHELYELITRKG